MAAEARSSENQDNVLSIETSKDLLRKASFVEKKAENEYVFELPEITMMNGVTRNASDCEIEKTVFKVVALDNESVAIWDEATAPSNIDTYGIGGEKYESAWDKSLCVILYCKIFYDRSTNEDGEATVILRRTDVGVDVGDPAIKITSGEIGQVSEDLHIAVQETQSRRFACAASEYVDGVMYTYYTPSSWQHALLNSPYLQVGSGFFVAFKRGTKSQWESSIDNMLYDGMPPIFGRD